MWKKGYRTLTKNKEKVIPIIILMTFTIGFGTVMFDMQDARSKLMEELIDISDFADGFVYMDFAPESVVNPAMDSLVDDYIKQYESRMKVIVDFEINGEEYEGLIIGINFTLNSHLNRLVDLDKEVIDDYEFYMNWDFSDKYNIEAGQDITILYGTVEVTVEIEGIGFTPEFNYVPIHADVIFPSIEPYPVFYVSIDYLNTQILQLPVNYVNEILYKLEDDADQDEFEDEIKDSLGLYINTIIPQEEYPFIKMMREDEESDRQMLMSFLIVFIFGSIIVLLVIIHRLVESDLKSVSVFQGLGSNKGEIIGSYLIFNSLIFIISLVFGSILGFVMNSYFNDLLSNIMRIPFPQETILRFNNILLIGLLLYSLSLLATFLIVRKSFKMDVQQSLKHETKFLEKTGLIERLALKINKNLHPFSKYNIRRAFGKKMFLGFLIIGLAISTCFLVFAFSLPDSIDYSIDKKLNETDTWDGMASTWLYESKNDLEDNMTSISGIDIFEFGITDTVEFSKKDSDFNDYLNIMAYKENSKLHVLEAENHKTLDDDDDDILVSKDILKDFNVKIGDFIYIKSISSSKIHEFTIIGSVNDMTQATIYLPLDIAQKVLEISNTYNTIYFTIEDDEDHEEVGDKVQDLEPIKYVVLKVDIKASLESAMDMMRLFTWIFGIIFMFFGLAIVAVIVKNLVDYRIEDYANMKALGLFDSELRKSLSKEIIIYFLVSVPLGLLLGFLLMLGIINSYSSVMPGLFVYMYPMSYLTLGICIGIMLIVVLLLQFRKLKYMNITEITKMKTFG